MRLAPGTVRRVRGSEKIAALACVLAALAAAACNAILGVHDPILDGDASVADGAVRDALPDVATGCGAKADDALGIFVSPDGTDSATCGSRAAPCKTVNNGLLRAATVDTKGVVYVAAGVYVEAIVLRGGILLAGGFQVVGSEWTFVCGDAGASLTTIQAPPDKNITVLADGLAAPAKITTLTIRSKAGAAAPGESLYGVFARGASTSLALDDVIVVVGDGGDGVMGNAGDAGASASGNCPPGDGGAGAPSTAPGAGGDGGALGPSGYSAANGGTGASGASGSNGPPAQAGSCAACVKCSGGTLSCTPLADNPSCGGDGNLPNSHS